MENYGESPAITTFKGLLGAVIGAIPGMIVWIILGKIGVVASVVGMLISAGIIFGFSFMTKNANLNTGIVIVICLGVFLVSMLLSEKIVWTWELAETFKSYLPTFREEIITSVMAEDSTLTRADVKSILTDDLYNEILQESFGVKEGTFSECFSNFSVLLEKLELKSEYTASLFKSMLFGIVGGGAFFAKVGV